MSRRDYGYTLLRFMDGTGISFAAGERERAETAFREQARFFQGSDEYGGTVLVSLEDLRAVFYFPPAALEAAHAEHERDKLEGRE